MINIMVFLLMSNDIKTKQNSGKKYLLFYIYIYIHIKYLTYNNFYIIKQNCLIILYYILINYICHIINVTKL